MKILKPESGVRSMHLPLTKLLHQLLCKHPPEKQKGGKADDLTLLHV